MDTTPCASCGAPCTHLDPEDAILHDWCPACVESLMFVLTADGRAFAEEWRSYTAPTR